MPTLPFKTNQTCDVYRSGNAPPAAPDVPQVPIYLENRYQDIKPGSPYTHIVRFAVGVDIRDTDGLVVPDQTQNTFTVVFVARVGKGTSADHKIAYVNRTNAIWPTDDL